jgi:alkylated DNA repair dioxygenase AlkB
MLLQVATVSLGAPRYFELGQIPASGDPAVEVAQLLTAGSLCVMAGNTQATWAHRVPPMEGGGCRISLTFRNMVAEG